MKKKEPYKETVVEMQIAMNRMEQTIEMSYNCIANYRQLWTYLLKQPWYREHLPDIRKYMENMDTSILNKHEYGLPKHQSFPKQWFINRIGRTVVRINPINLNHSNEKITEDNVNRFWLDSEKGYIFQDLN